MKHLIVGTAGHIDHGKSSLVRALTGIDPDRLKEEKERGLTIDLGFAHFDLPDGNRVAFVDVPGHERFVKNMLAGAAGMDIVILVIDATESVMPQTREHLDIMRLLGISRGIIAVTKIDLADDEMIDIVEEELHDLLIGTFLEHAPIARVSSRTGEGMDDIRRMIADAVDKQQKKNESGLFRFPIDRVFTMKGFGTVITGTVFSGSINEDESVLVLPGNLHSRARQLQSHNTKLAKVSAGMRAALNLANVSVQELKRGDTLVRPGTARATHLIDAKITLIASAPRSLSRSSTIKLYSATSQCVARMTLADSAKLDPGGETYARLRLSQPLCIFRGDRFVVRGESPEFTIGGGVVLDITPVRLKRKGQDRIEWLKRIQEIDRKQLVLAFLSQMKLGSKLQDLAMRMSEPLDDIRAIIAEHEKTGNVLAADAGGDLFAISREAFEQLNDRLMQELTVFFKLNPHRLSMPREELRSRLGPELIPHFFEKSLRHLIDGGKVESASDGVRLARREANLTKAQLAAKLRIENIFVDAGFSPPTLSQVQELLENAAPAKQMTSLLIEEGILVKISPTLAYHRTSLETAITRIRNHFDKADTLGVGDLKEALGISRKHAVPLLEYFDKIGLTLRKGDFRILKKTPQK